MRITSKWTENEAELLKEKFPSGSRESLLELFHNRTWTSIRMKAWALGLHRPHINQFNNPWKPEEIRLLRENYTRLELDALCQVLPNHPWASICSKASMIGLRERRILIDPQANFDALTELEIGYFAGIIDGEGSIGIIRHVDKRQKKQQAYSFVPYLSVGMTHNGAIDHLRALLFRSNLHPTLSYKKACNNHSASYEFRLTRMAEVRAMLSFIVPYLRVKNAQALLVLSFIESRIPKLRQVGAHKGVPYSDQELEVYKRVQLLNKFKQRYVDTGLSPLEEFLKI